eukprot:TRINITY_DN40527_c0_g1_i1.p1 TRINITY_DN40527_c0_g1~~TRINITY_DN40527_c0_g1_i1.p1  ORF type:complete len:428 (-),score=111.96 TRINITY_DN40527_c0_g1_i1:139-1422(-)
MDKKRLRELMKKEKEERAAARGASSATIAGTAVTSAASSAGRRPVVASVAAGSATAPKRLLMQAVKDPARPQCFGDSTATLADTSSVGASAGGSTPAAAGVTVRPNGSSGLTSGPGRGGGGLLGSYGEDDSDEEAVIEPPEKRPRTTAAAAVRTPVDVATEATALATETASTPAPLKAAGGGTVASTTERSLVAAAADAAAMPPPMGLPVRSRASAAALTLASSMPPSVPSDVSARPTVPSPAQGDVGEADAPDACLSLAIAEPTLAVVTAGEDGEAADDDRGDEVPHEQETKPDGLPEGFFDDPEADARARGVETPSERKKRELEDGMKRFAREIEVEQEKGEETRYELEEARFEEVVEDEEDFQHDLQSRIEVLRRRQSTKMQEAAEMTADVPVALNAGKGSDDEGDGEDSGSDVDFDWRAKGFA